jgi:hypothetical protein
LRKILREMPPERVRWAYLARPMAGAVPDGLPEYRAFPPRMLPWRLRTRAINYWYTHKAQARGIAESIAGWAEPFRPQVIWVLAELGAVNVAYHLGRRMRVPVHATVHDSYAFARFAMPRAYYPVYARDVRRLLASIRSMDAVSEELLRDVRAGFAMPALSDAIVFPPSIAPSHMAEAVSRRGAADRRRKIALCGSVRIDEAQWKAFLGLLEKLPFEFDVLAYAERSAFFNTPTPRNVTLSFQDYAGTEAEVVQRFNREAVDACYLGLTFRDDQRVFAKGSLSSKLITYCAAACQVIVHGPAESVVWRYVEQYGAGIRCDTDEQSGLEALQRLFADDEARLRMAAGASRLCRQEFDLKRNVARFAELLSRTAATAG